MATLLPSFAAVTGAYGPSSVFLSSPSLSDGAYPSMFSSNASLRRPENLSVILQWCP